MKIVLALLCVAAACGDDEPTTPANPDAPTVFDAKPVSMPGDADPSRREDAAVAVADAPALPDAGPTFNLTIDNYIAWCDVTANGQPFPLGLSETVAFPQGSTVQLHADPQTSFVWGYWTGTANVGGDAGHDTGQSTSITLDGDKVVHVCCPEPNLGCTF